MSCQDPLSLEANRRVISRKLETRLRLEECIAESDLIGIFQEGVGLVVRVDVEEDRHIDLLTRVKPLLLETEALDLVEVGPGLERNHIVGRNPVDRSEIFYIETSRCRSQSLLVCGILRSVEGESRLSRVDVHHWLLGTEVPSSEK